MPASEMAVCAIMNTQLLTYPRDLWSQIDIGELAGSKKTWQTHSVQSLGANHGFPLSQPDEHAHETRRDQCEP
jgi:hypothetical protein